MFKRIFSLFLALGVLALGSNCVHVLAHDSFMAVPQAYALEHQEHGGNKRHHDKNHKMEAELEQDLPGCGDSHNSNSMSCCYDAHSGQSTTFETTQTTQLLKHSTSALQNSFCHQEHHAFVSKKRFTKLTTLYSSPPSRIGIDVKKE